MRFRGRAARTAAVLAVSVLALAACGDDSSSGDSGDSGDSGSEDSSAPAAYMVDGNTYDYSEDFDPGTLEGVKATYPGAELGADFQDRLLKIDPDLKNFTYGPESYDATTVVALAATAAQNDTGKAIAEQMQAVSADGEKCTDFAACAKLLDQGKDIDYDGVSGPLEFNSTGSPTDATIGIFQYADDNTYSNIDYVNGEVEDTGEVLPGQEVVQPIGKGDGVLKIGTLLPSTGDLAFLGPPEFAGVNLALEEINAAGGVLGKPVETTDADSGDGSPNIAPTSVDKLLGENVDVVLGAASSSVSSTVIDKITTAGVLQISPANTSTIFDTYKDKGLYFRTAPSDVLQGRVMANLLTEDGQINVALLVRNDVYGVALADNVEKFFTESGGTIVARTEYDPTAATYSAEVEELAASDPDAIVLITFDELKKIIPEMVDAGIAPNS